MIQHSNDKDLSYMKNASDRDLEHWANLFLDMELTYGQFGSSAIEDLKVFPWWLAVVNVNS